MTALFEARNEGEQVGPCPTSAPVPLGTTPRYDVGSILVGKYRLESILGVGAMGTVWQATNLLLDAPVAIKLAHAELADATFRARLQLEARAAATFVHPGIVRVFDVGETDAGDPFIVMELLQGATLAQMASEGRLAPIRAVQILLPIIDALAAMHARGVVHRDLKPDNLLIGLEDERVQPKILDFGIAISNEARGGPRAIDDGGVLVGSPEYMSPEQADASDDIDHRTDIWSICVVLYEALAGETPFTASHALLLLRAITMDEPVSLVDRAVADEQLWDIVRVGLSKDRRDRHASMSELGKKLAGWLLDRGVHEDVCGTSLLTKWFAADDGVPTIRTATYRPNTVAFVRTTPPRSSRSRSISPRRASRRARARSLRALKACTAVAAMGLAFFATRPPSGLLAGMVPPRPHVVEPIAWSPLPARESTPVVRPALDTTTVLAVADVARPQDASNESAATSHEAVMAAQRARQNVPLRKAPRAIGRAQLDLLDPY